MLDPVENSTDSQTTHSVLPLLIVIARRIRLLVIIPLLCSLAALAYSKSSPPVYTAYARILPPQYNENTVMAMQNQLGGESQLGNSALTLKNPTDLFVGILGSRTIGDGVIENEKLLDYYDEPEMGEVRSMLAKNTTIRAGKDGIVSIIIDDHDAQKAADLANAYVNQFYAFSQDLARQQSVRRARFYDDALDSAKAKLLAADIQLSQTETVSGFTRLTGQDEAIVQRAAELQAQISAREIQLKTMSTYATESNPDVKLLRKELTHLKRELRNVTAPASTDESVTSSTDTFVDLGDVPAALLDHTRSARDVAYWESIVLWLGRFSEMGKIDESRDMSLFQVLDWAIPPHKKSGPRAKVNAILAFIGSGFVCLLWILVTAGVARRRNRSDQFDDQWQELVSTLKRAFLIKRKRPST